MALKYSGATSKYWWVPSIINNPADFPVITMTAWFRLASGYSGNASLFGVGNGSTTYNGVSSWNGNIAANERNSGGGSGAQSIIANPTDLAWHFVAFNFTSTTIYGGADGILPRVGAATQGQGVGGGAQDVGGTGTQFTRFFVGGGGNIPFLNGTSTLLHVAELAIWNTIFGQQEVSSLYQGASPLSLGIAPSTLMYYFPLRDDLIGYGPYRYPLKASTTAMKALFVDHPPYVEDLPIPNRPFLYKSSGGVTPPPSSATIRMISVIT